MKTYYHLLGVSSYASEKEIRRAFCVLAMRYHPDVSTLDDTATDKFKDIVIAYETLSNDTKRAVYDNSLLAGTSYSYLDRTDSDVSPNFASSHQIDKKSLPFFLVVWCWLGFAFVALLAIDYALPYQQNVQLGVKVWRLYNTPDEASDYSRYALLVTRGLKKITLSHNDFLHFRNQTAIKVYRTMILSTMVSISPIENPYNMNVSLLYGTIFFLPLILLITSLLGLLVRGDVYLRLSFSVASFMLLLVCISLAIAW